MVMRHVSSKAAMTTGVGGLAPLTKSHTPVENVYYYRRGYYGYRRPYYGYGYRRHYYGYGYRPYTAMAIDGPTMDGAGGISRNFP
jgi:hypothetical protein